MGKFLFLIISLVYFGNATAQDSIAPLHQPKTELVLTIDSTSIMPTAFPQNFKSKYKDVAFAYEFKTPEKNAWDRFMEWLSNIFKNLFHFTSDEASMNVVVVVLKTIAVLIVVFVIYLIVKAVMNKEGKWIFGKNSDAKIIRYDELEKNLHALDFEMLIKTATESDEKRAVIRYYYLWFLKKLSDRQLIQWDIEKTNSDYLYEIQNQKTKDRFAYLSYLYDHIWYGEFEPDDADFTKTLTAFDSAIKSVSHE